MLILVSRVVKGEFIYTHQTLCVQTAKAMLSMRICAVSLEPSLLDHAISTKASCAVQISYHRIAYEPIPSA